MIAATDRLEFAPPAPPGFMRALGLAVIAHMLLVAALTWGVKWKSEPLTWSTQAELWSAVPQEAAPQSVGDAPEATLAPEKPVPPPPATAQEEPKPKAAEVSQAEIALAKEKLLRQQQQEKKLLRDKQQAEKLKQEKQAQEKERLEKKRLQEKRTQDKREQDKKIADEKKQKALELERKAALQAKEDATRIEAQRQANLKRMTGLAGASGAATATGKDVQSSGPSAGYAGRIRARIKPNIVFTEDIESNPIAEVDVRTSPDGTIISRTLIKSSGVTAWDNAVLKAIDKTVSLPRDVDGRVPAALVISFRPKD